MCLCGRVQESQKDSQVFVFLFERLGALGSLSRSQITPSMAVSRTSLLASAVSALVVVLVNISQAKAMVAFDNYQYTDGPMGVYWYVLPDQQNIKIMFQFDFGNSSSAVDKWLGIGFREAGFVLFSCLALPLFFLMFFVCFREIG